MRTLRTRCRRPPSPSKAMGLLSSDEFHPFGLGRRDLLVEGRHLGAGAAVLQDDLGRAEAQRRAGGVDGHVAAADDHDPLAAQVELLAAERPRPGTRCR